jgi:hypothetical protein
MGGRTTSTEPGGESAVERVGIPASRPCAATLNIVPHLTEKFLIFWRTALEIRAFISKEGQKRNIDSVKSHNCV